ncbi:MAG: hypothetical protein ACREC5_05220 [Thermoplasmata archaeon]
MTLEFARGGRSELCEVETRAGTPLRTVLREAGHPAEGSLVLHGEKPVPLDTPVIDAARYTVISTFSGG